MRTSKTGTCLALAFALSPAAAATAPGGPVRGLSPDELQRFTDGKAAFEEVEGVADGLGPVFNGTSCAGCHDGGATGGGSAKLETRFATVVDGVFDPMTSHGGPLIQIDGIGAQGACSFGGEVVPPEATLVARRRTTPLFGLGLVDAVPDARFVALAAQQARRHPDTAGHPNMVADVVSGGVSVGRFGWKSQVPHLLQFSADAYLNEMGITTPLFPNENCPQGDCAALACLATSGPDDADLDDVERFADFMGLLAPPERARNGFVRDDSGRQLFARVGCADCHVRSLTSGPSPFAALAFRRFEPYSDFLLHDMGSLGDGMEQGQATGGEMRTAPLWGLRFVTTFLHDGRAATVDDAILAHDGQGRGARDRFLKLPPSGRAALVAFLRTL